MESLFYRRPIAPIGSGECDACISTRGRITDSHCHDCYCNFDRGQLHDQECSHFIVDSLPIIISFARAHGMPIR